MAVLVSLGLRRGRRCGQEDAGNNEDRAKQPRGLILTLNSLHFPPPAPTLLNQSEVNARRLPLTFAALSMEEF